MPLKSIVFLVGFVATCGISLRFPIIGVIGYILHYHIAPEKQWWGQSIAEFNIRYSLTLAACIAAGIWLNRRRLFLGVKVLLSQEWLLILFLAVIWFCALIGPQSRVSMIGGEDPPELKLAKVMIFVLMLTHLASTPKNVSMVFWAIVVGVAWLGYQARFAGTIMYQASGRLDNIGGPDFADSNAFATHLAASLPIIGVQFFRSGWKGKLLCLVSGVLVVNAIILTRSRGALVGLAAGIPFAIFAAPKEFRKRILVGIVVATIGAYLLTDQGFRQRTETILLSGEERDKSAQSRLDIWKGSLEMVWEHPLGVGPRRFLETIGDYVPQHPDRDAHSTFVLCYSELGIQGFLVLIFLILNALRLLRQTYGKCKAPAGPEQRTIIWLNYGVAVALPIYVFGGLTTTMLYVEGLWWFLALPVCLVRATQSLVPQSAGARGKTRKSPNCKLREAPVS